MNRIVKPKRNKSVYQLGHYRESWETILEYNGKDIPKDIKLTDNTIEHWKKDKSCFNYVNFKTLTEDDIWSILSATKRLECMININRWGYISCYKITKEII